MPELWRLRQDTETIGKGEGLWSLVDYTVCQCERGHHNFNHNERRRELGLISRVVSEGHVVETANANAHIRWEIVIGCVIIFDNPSCIQHKGERA